MRPTRRSKPQTTVSLFPFLAVLICTMGALIVLLVLVVQQARVQAQEMTTAALEEELFGDKDPNSEAKEEFEWRFEMLSQQREAVQSDVRDHAAELAHLEQHIRELKQQWKQLQEHAERMKQIRDHEFKDGAAQSGKMTKLEAAINQTLQELEAAKNAAAKRPKSYAIVPYRGANGTYRRPIYVECRADGIFLMPEGVRITQADFGGLVGPGNPLDAALRTVREYLADAGIDGDTYPLLVVRPDGAETYSVARAAMRTWDDEFGYELVDTKMQLKYPPPDLELAKRLKKAVVEARRRQAVLAAAMPSAFGGGGGGGEGGAAYVASRRGGFVAIGDADRRTSTAGRMNAFGQGFYAPSGSTRRVGGSSAARGGQSNLRGSQGDAAGRDAGSQNANSQRGQNGSAGGAFGRPGQRQANQTNGAGGGAAQANQNGSRFGTGAQGATQGAAGGSPGSGSPGGTPGVGAAGGGASSPGGSPNFAAQRGQDWALPSSASGAIQVTRPIRIACAHDRLVILPDKGDSQARPHVIPLHGPVHAHIDRFVQQLWEVVGGWQIAVPGGYWQPVLNVEVAAGGERRFLELKNLLRDSGLPVKRVSR